MKNKTLELIATVSGARIEPLRFRNQVGKFHKGYAVVDPAGNELMELEPVHYSNGDRWKAIDRTEGGRGLFYVKSLRSLKGMTLKTGFTGFKFNN